MNLMKVKSSFLEQIRIRQNNPAQRRILRYKSRSRNDTARNLALQILEFRILKFQSLRAFGYRGKDLRISWHLEI